VAGKGWSRRLAPRALAPQAGAKGAGAKGTDSAATWGYGEIWGDMGGYGELHRRRKHPRQVPCLSGAGRGEQVM